MSALYLRQARLVVGATQIDFGPSDGLRFSFHVSKNPKAQQPNAAQVHISNLSKETRDKIASAFDPALVGPQNPGLTTVTLWAGYAGTADQPGTMGIVFKGHSINSISTRAGADWETRILAIAGVLTNDVRVTQTYSAGVDFATIMQKVLQAAGSAVKDIDFTQAIARVQKGDFKGAFDQVFKRGFVVSGPAMRALNNYLTPKGFEIYEQDGKVQCLHIGEVLPGQAIALGPSTGLIGTLSPIRDSQLPGVQIIRGRSLLRHEMQIGTALSLQSEVATGIYKVRKLTHVGDTHGPNWYTDFEAIHCANLVEA